MADDLKIVVKALLDEKDLRAQTEAIKDVTIHGKIVIDKADLKKQIDSIAGESSKFGNKFKIKYGVDKGDFVKQFRVAGEEAKVVVEKALAGAGAGVNIPLNIDPDAVKTLKNELKKLDFDDGSIASATKELEGMNITVGKIKRGYESIADAQAGLKTLTISGIDKQGNQDVTIIQKYNAESKELLKTQIQVTAKYNEMGEAATRVATTMRGTGGEAANQVFTEKLNRLINDLKTSGVYTDEMKQKTDELAASLKGAFDQSSIDAVNDQYRVLIERAKTLKQEATAIANSPATRIDTNTAKLSTSLSYQGMDAQTAGITNLRNEINSLIAEYGRLKVSMDGLDPNSAEFQALGVQVDALDTRFKSATKAAELFNGSFANENKLTSVADQIERAKTKLAEMEVRWSKFKGNPELLAEFDALRASAEKLDAIGLPNFTKQMQAFESHVRASGANMRSFGDELKNALAKFGLWISASTIFMQAWRGVRQMVDSVKELDAALVEFNKVADLSSSQLDKFVDRAFEAGEALGRTGTEVIQATAIFKQAGYSVEESLNLANSALIMKNVSENIESTAAAASDLIAVMKGFDLAVSDSMSIVDMINNVSNNLPISFGAIDEGLTRISGTLAQTGTSIQETIGLITGGFASLRNVEKVSSGLIQISQRLRGIGESGETIDGLAPKLQSMFKEIAGVDIADTNGELRSTFDILSDLAKVSDDLNSKEKQLLFQAASGTRQVTVLNSIIQNWDDVTLAIDKATNSTGSAMQENEKFLDSIQGKTNRLASSFQMLASNTIESGAIKGLIDFANALVQVIDKIGPLQTALLAITGFTTLFSNGKLAGTVASLGKSFLNMGKTFLMLPKTIKQSNENFIGPLQAAAPTISSFRLAVLGVTAAFTVAKVALDSYDNSLAEHTKRAQDAISKWSDTSDALADTKQAIETIGPEFEKLSSGVDTYGNNISLTSEQFDRYNQIANQVAAMFPEMVVGYTDQGTAILSTAGYVSELTDAYEKQELAARRASAASANVVFEAFKRRTSTGDFLGRGEVPLESERDVINAIINAASSSDSRVVTLKDIVSEMGRAGVSGNYSNDAFKSVVEGAGLQTLSAGSNDFSTKWLKENIGLAFAYRDALISQLESETNAAKPFIESIMFGTKKYQGLSDDAKQAVSNIVSELGYEYYSQFSSERDASAGLGRDILMPLEGDSSLLSGISIIEDASAKFKDGKKSVGEYTAAWAEFQGLVSNSNLKPAVAEAITSTYDIGSVEPLIANVKKKLPAELSDMVGELSNRQLQIAGKMEIDPATIGSWQEFLALIAQSEAVLSSLTIGERIAAIASAASVANTAFSEQGYSAAVTKEQYDALAEAGEEYVSVIDNTNGYLSINKKKLDALILSKRNEEKANIAVAKAAKLQEFDKNAEAMRMNTLALNTLTGMTDEYKQSIIDKNAALLSSQEAILAEVNNLDLQASALEYATSAYKRWKDARNAPEAGDMYDDLSNAWKDIEEGLKTGKVGTEKYLSAAELLLPDSISPNDAKAINNYKKSVMRYFAEDGKGLSTFLSDTAKLGFLDKLSDGRYVSNAKTNVEDIAKSLNLTTDSVEAMFLALKDYSGTIELNDQSYKTTELTKELAKATKDVTDAQEALNKARSGGASKEEISRRESELKAAQDEAQIIASQSPVEVPVELTLEEHYAKKIENLELLIKEAGNLKIPVELTIEAEKEVEKLRGLVKAITDADAIIAEAKVTGDTTEIDVALAKITTPSEDDPNYAAVVEINAYLTDKYKAAIEYIESLEVTPPSAEIGVEESGASDAKNAIDEAAADRASVIGVTAPGADALDGKLDGIASKPREAKITVDDAALIGAEERLAKIKAEYEKYNKDGPPFDEAYGGNTRKTSPQEIAEMWESQGYGANPLGLPVYKYPVKDTPSGGSNPRVDLDEEVSIVDTLTTSLNAATSAAEQTNKSLSSIEVPPLDVDTSKVVSKTDAVEKDIEGRTPTLTVGVEYKSGSGNFVPRVETMYAKGTQKAKKGVALTGELGVETVITKDGFYTVGHDGPELVNLRGGEEILNDKETKKLFNGEEKRTRGQAFGLGTGGFLSNLINSVKTVVKKVADVVKANKPATTTVGVDTRAPSGSGSNKGGGGGSSAPAPVEEAKEEIKTDFEDWIPRLLDNVRKETDKILANAEKQISYQSQNSEIEKALANNTKLMDLNAQATNRYLQQASQVGLSADLIAKVQNGSIDIALYDENTRKLIADYQKWYDLAQKTKDTITSLQEEQRKLAMSKLDNVQGYYENRIGVYGNRLDIANSTMELGQATGREIRREDYAPMISDVNAQLALLRQEKAEYERTFTELVASGIIKEGSNDWYQYTAQVDDMQKSILQASLSLDEFNDLADAIAVNNLNVAIKYLNTVQGTLESVQGLRQAQGKELTAVDYEHLISVGMQQVSTLEAQNLELLKQQEGLDVLSSAYQEIQDQIDGNLNGIWNIKISQEGWNDAITDLNINAIKKSNDQYNRQLETMRAIEELEKAKQRRSLVYREGRGFVYEADQGALRDAQRAVDQINVDNLIASLEESKANDNVYDNTGNLLGKLFTGLDGVDFSGYLQSVGSGNETSALLANAIKSIDWNSIKTASGASTSVEFSGGINLYGVDNVQDLAKAINYRLGGYVVQGLYNND